MINRRRNHSRLGHGIQLHGTAASAVTYGMGHLGNIAASGLKIAAPGISDKAVTGMVDKLANKLASTPEGITALKNIGLMAASGFGEFAEGFLESALDPYLRRLTYDKDAETIFQNTELLHDAIYDGMIESILGVFGEGINLTVNSDATANSDTSLQDSYKSPVQNSEGHGILGTEGDVARKPQQELSPKELAEIGEALLSSGIMPDQKYLDAMGLSAADARGMLAVLEMGKEGQNADITVTSAEHHLSTFDTAHLAKNTEELLPNYQDAKIPDDKMTEYALNKDHPTGKHKAIAFEKALGYNADNKHLLLSQVYQGLEKYRAIEHAQTQYGRPFEVSMMVLGANGRYAKVKTAWIIDNGAEYPRLVSIYVDE